LVQQLNDKAGKEQAQERGTLSRTVFVTQVAMALPKGASSGYIGHDDAHQGLPARAGCCCSSYGSMLATSMFADARSPIWLMADCCQFKELQDFR
jgi:hypothetical protein